MDRQWRLLLCSAFLVLAFLFYAYQDSSRFSLLVSKPPPPTPSHSPARNLVFEHPTAKFRDNLSPDKKYIMTFSSAGWTNDLMGFFNIIYLAILTDRIPILLPFWNNSRHNSSTPTYMGDMFDLHKLSASLGIEILEWRDVTTPEFEDLEVMGCWSTALGAEYRSLEPSTRKEIQKMERFESLRTLGLDVSWTKTPDAIYFSDREFIWRLHTFMALSYPDTSKRVTANNVTSPSWFTETVMKPEDNLFCVDSTFYMSAAQGRDMFDSPWSLSWRFVAKYAHYRPHLVDQAKELLRDAFELKDNEPIPPFIAIHVRRTDFFDIFCESADRCLPTPMLYQTSVREIMGELLRTKGIDAERVIVTSDDMVGFWKESEAAGLTQDSPDGLWKAWSKVNHEKMGTLEKYGGWYPPVFDSIIHSLSIGFVGTELSTFSELSRLRVRDFNGGIWRTVSLGLNS